MLPEQAAQAVETLSGLPGQEEPDCPLAAAAIAPSDWHYPLFPLTAKSEEEVSLDWLVVVAYSRLSQTRDMEEREQLGPVLHWAHLLKFEQAPEGDWPAVVNARTGAAIGSGRTRAPGELMAELEEHLLSSEFEEAVKLARSGPVVGRE